MVSRETLDLVASITEEEIGIDSNRNSSSIDQNDNSQRYILNSSNLDSKSMQPKRNTRSAFRDNSLKKSVAKPIYDWYNTHPNELILHNIS